MLKDIDVILISDNSFHGGSMRNTVFMGIICLSAASLLNYGCASYNEPAKTAQTESVQQKKSVNNVYKGAIVGKSNLAKTISIQVGKGSKAKTMMVKFDDNTKGLDHVQKGHAAIISFEKRTNGNYATVIKPKLAKLPAGVTEIKTKELEALVDQNTQLFLVDSRPASRYGQSHLPDAVSIPVPLLKEKKSSLLPKDKDTLLVFYCGGPT